MRTIVLGVAALVLLTGCLAPRIQLVSPGQVEIAERFQGTPGCEWSSLRAGRWEQWTVEGSFLVALEFYAGINEGQTLWPAEKDAKLPRFVGAMAASEIVEFLADSFVAAGASGVEVTEVRPRPFTGRDDGLEVTFDFTTRDGLEKSALAVSAIVGGELYLALYAGERSSYYPKHLTDVNQLIDTLQLRL